MASTTVGINVDCAARAWEEDRNALISAEVRRVLRYVRLQKRLEGLTEAETGFSVGWDGGGVKVSSWFIASRFKAEVQLRTCLRW